MEPGLLSPRSLMCPVCLRKFRGCGRIGKPDKCKHWFCFPCIHEWSKNVNTCPVDRMKFNFIEVFSEISGPLIEKVFIPDCSLFESTNEVNDVTYCEVCNECYREDRLLLCDGCDKGYHLECLTPPLVDVPTGNWYCIDCIPIINSQYTENFSESEQDISNTFGTQAYGSDSDVILGTGPGTEYETNSDVICLDDTGLESDSDASSVVGMRHRRDQRGVIIEESTSELSVTGESSDEEILATKLRRALQREASKASRIPLIRESSTTSSTSCSNESKFDLEEGTTMVLTVESDRDNTFVDVVGSQDDVETECGDDVVLECGDDDCFIEIDSVVCEDGGDKKNKTVTGAEKNATVVSTTKNLTIKREFSESKFSREGRQVIGGSRDRASRDRNASSRTDSNGCSTSKINSWWYSDRSPRSSRSKDEHRPSFTRDKMSSTSKRRLVFSDEEFGSTKRGVDTSPSSRVESSRRGCWFGQNGGKKNVRGKEAVSKTRRELASKKRLHCNRNVPGDIETHHPSSSLVSQPQTRASTKSSSLVVKPPPPPLMKIKQEETTPLDDDDSSSLSGYVDEAPFTDMSMSIASQKQSDRVRQQQHDSSSRLQNGIGTLSSRSGDDLVQTNDHKEDTNRANNHQAVDRSGNPSRRGNPQRPTSQRPPQRKRKKIVLNPQRRQLTRKWSPPPRRTGTKGKKKKKKWNKRFNNRSSTRSRNDSNYCPPRTLSLDTPELTPRTSLARTAATHHSAMREAVRASYCYDSQEVGLKYAREILAQQRRTAPWKTALSFTPSQSSHLETSTPLSGYSDRTLTPGEGVSYTPFSPDTPKRERPGLLNQYKESPGSLSLFLRRQVNRSSKAPNCGDNSRSIEGYSGWGDHAPPLPLDGQTKRSVNNRIVSFNDHQGETNRDMKRRVVYLGKNSRSRKRHLTEVLVTPVKVRIREAPPSIESDNGGGKADLLSQLCQNLTDLQNKRNVIRRDGSIVPIREDDKNCISSPFEQDYEAFDPHQSTSVSDYTSYPSTTIHSVPADSTTSDSYIATVHHQHQHHHHHDHPDHHDTALQNHHHHDSSSHDINNPYSSTAPQLHDFVQQETHLLYNFDAGGSNHLHIPTSKPLPPPPLLQFDNRNECGIDNDSLEKKNGGTASSNEPEEVVSQCLDKFYKDGKINSHQYKRIFERSTRKVKMGVGRIHVDRVMKLVKDFVDAYTTAPPQSLPSTHATTVM